MPPSIARAGVCAALALAACNKAHDDPTVEKAWVRLSPVAGRPAAAYFTVTSRNEDRCVRLVRIESRLAQRIELHKSMAGMGGMTTMKPLADVPLPPYGTIVFAPGGSHAMIYGLDKAVAPGTTVPLRFSFAHAGAVEVQAEAVAAGGDAPH